MVGEQIFLSYARDDDKPPPENASAKGFVSYLVEQLNYEFRQHGQPRPMVWQDRGHIEPGDQIDPAISEALNKSTLLLVILSRTWLCRPNCRLELDMFGKLWAGESQLDRKRRIIVVSKNYVALEDRPTLLQGQEGYRFFHLDDPAEVGKEFHFYERGEVKDRRYFEAVQALGSLLWRLAKPPAATPTTTEQQALPAATITLTTAPKGAVEQKIAHDPGTATEPELTADPNKKRLIYVAKPAGDMREAYQRLVEELTLRGFGIVPAADREIPSDLSADTFVAEELSKAELAVHLLGERAGFAPENAEPVVTLQLAAARQRVDVMQSDRAGITPFRRIIWAPRVFGHDQQARSGVGRDPLEVLARFDRQVDGDKIEGQALSDFVSVLVAYLDKTAPRAEKPTGIDANASVYIYHQNADTGYAIDLAKALKERQIKPVFPALEGDPAELEAMHRKKLSDCDAVVLCWANAPEVWVHAQSDGLRDWREFGRKQEFAFRGVVAGPPPGTRKRVFLEFPPSDDIDLVLDLTEVDRPPAEALDPLIRAATLKAS